MVDHILDGEREARDWGRWTLKPSTCVLTWRDDDRRWYEIDLDRCLTSSQVLDWIMQVNAKSLDMDIAGLVNALDDVLNPQHNLCSFGGDRALTKADIQRSVDAAAERWPDRVDDRD